MKNILYTIILSFLFSSSYAGTVDGRALICHPYNLEDVGESIGIFFTNGGVIKYYISGHLINDVDRGPYTELGTNVIKWSIGKLNRKNLNVSEGMHGRLRSFDCKLVNSKTEVLDILNQIIALEKKNNQL